MLTHQEARSLLAVFALDAIDSDEHALVELHLSTCPACRAELDGHREVAAALGNSVEPLPEELWPNISSNVALRSNGPPPTPGFLRAVPSSDEIGEFPKAASSLFRGRGRTVTLVSVAAAAAAAAVLLGINLVGADNQVAHLQGAIGEAAHTAVVAALETPGRKIVDLDTADRHQLAQLVILPSGQGYLAGSSLPPLPSKETYQLWGVIDGQTISLGLLGTNPRVAAFSLARTPLPSTLGITVESADGSVLPSESMLATGKV
jgi:anti-sigma factor RsiW